MATFFGIVREHKRLGLLQKYICCLWIPRKHGRGTRGAAPASDAARRGTRRPTRLPARRTASAFFFFFFFSDSRRLGSIRADAA